MFYEKDVLKKFTLFTEKHQCRSLSFNKVGVLRNKRFPVNFTQFLRTSFLHNTSGRLLLIIYWFEHKHKSSSNLRKKKITLHHKTVAIEGVLQAISRNLPEQFFAWNNPYPVDTGRKLNVYKTFRKHSRRLLNVLCTFNLPPVDTGRDFFRNFVKSLLLINFLFSVSYFQYSRFFHKFHRIF